MRGILAVLVVLVLSVLPAEARRHHGHHVKHRSAALARALVSGGAVGGLGAQIVAHPTGCPRRLFCGCGVAVHVFGAPIRSLWLATSWLRFPSAPPGPGMVAARAHHVFAIVQNLGGGRVLAYDPNSGRGLTRIHARSLAGYRVVNPRG